MTDPAWLDLARAELAADTREVPGPGINPRIASYYETLGVQRSRVDDDGDPWCAVFTSAMLRRAGLVPPQRFRAARSFCEWGQACERRVGAVIVLERIDPHAPTVPHGHVGFWLHEDAGRVWLLSGNSGNRVSVHGYDPARVIACRWPTAGMLAAAGLSAAGTRL